MEKLHNPIIAVIFGVGLVCTVVYGRPHHHMRHQEDLVTEALRQRLGLASMQQGSDDNVMPKTIQMRVVSPDELINTIRSSVHGMPEHRHHGLMDSHLGSRFAGLGLGLGQNGDGEMQMNPVRQLVMAALNHVLANLQTVEGGQEAARWLTALRGNDQQTQPTQKTLLKTTTEKYDENESPITIQLFSTTTSSTTTVSSNDDEENKVDSNL